MMSRTHAYIADKIYEYLKDQHGIVLNKMFLKYGSIKPDYTLKLAAIGHYKEDSIEFIQDEISKLSSMPLIRSKEALKQYSIRLGVIIHYISDYFCRAHNDNILKKDIVKHLLYESKLHNYISRLENEMVRSTPKISVPYKSLEDIIDYLNQKLQNCSKNKRISYLNDLKYAVEVSSNISLYIIQLSLIKSKEIAA